MQYHLKNSSKEYSFAVLLTPAPGLQVAMMVCTLTLTTFPMPPTKKQQY